MAKPRARRPASQTPGRASGSGADHGWTDLAEGAGERFEEATDHAQQLREFAGFRLGPTVQVPMADVTPGAIAWSRTLSWGRTPLEPTPPEEEGRIYYAILPSVDHSRLGEAPQSPLRSIPWDRFVFGEESRGTPRWVLLVHARSEVDAPLVRRFAASVREHLEREDD